MRPLRTRRRCLPRLRSWAALLRRRLRVAAAAGGDPASVGGCAAQVPWRLQTRGAAATVSSAASGQVFCTESDATVGDRAREPSDPGSVSSDAGPLHRRCAVGLPCTAIEHAQALRPFATAAEPRAPFGGPMRSTESVLVLSSTHAGARAVRWRAVSSRSCTRADSPASAGTAFVSGPAPTLTAVRRTRTRRSANVVEEYRVPGADRSLG